MAGPTVEMSLRLPVARNMDVQREAVHWRGAISYRVDGELIEVSFDVHREGDTAFAILSHPGRGMRKGGDDPQSYRIELTSTRQRLGGVRWWWLCPILGRRVSHLYLPLGAVRYGSRHAYRLSYATQRQSPSARARTRLQRGCVRLGGMMDLLDPLPDKPKWMRWPTYNRLIEKMEPVAEHVGDDFLRAFGRLPGLRAALP